MTLRIFTIEGKLNEVENINKIREELIKTDGINVLSARKTETTYKVFMQYNILNFNKEEIKKLYATASEVK